MCANIDAAYLLSLNSLILTVDTVLGVVISCNILCRHVRFYDTSPLRYRKKIREDKYSTSLLF